MRRMYDDERGHLLLHHADERELRDARRCRRAPSRASSRALPLLRRAPAEPSGRACSCSAAAPSSARRCGPQTHPRRALRRRRGRLERDQLQGTAPRRAASASAGTCLHPGEEPKVPYVAQSARRRPRAGRRGLGLREGRCPSRSPLGAAGRAARSAPTASAAATRRPSCAGSSRSTPSTSPWPRWPSWRAAARSPATNRCRGRAPTRPRCRERGSPQPLMELDYAPPDRRTRPSSTPLPPTPLGRPAGLSRAGGVPPAGPEVNRVPVEVVGW